MERASRLIGRNKFSKSLMDESQMVQAIWPIAVGKSIARHTVRMRVVRETLVVEVEDAIWQRQLRGMSKQILTRLQRSGAEAITVTEIDFRIGIRRREVQRAIKRDERQQTLFRAGDDESDRIADPVLKKVYQLSRRKAAG